MEEREEVFEANQAVNTIEVECDSVNFIVGEKFSTYGGGEMRIRFNWFTTILGRWKLLQKGYQKE